MTSKEKKIYRDKLFAEETKFLPELTKENKVYSLTSKFWIIFSIVYMVVALIMLIYMKRTDLYVSVLAIPAAALFCCYFISGGMSGMSVMTIIGGAFEIFRGFLMLSGYQIRQGRMWLAYTVVIIIQGALTLAVSLFIFTSPKIRHYLSVIKKINNRIMMGR